MSDGVDLAAAVQKVLLDSPKPVNIDFCGFNTAHVPF
jgi:hypothetical protein